MISLVMQLSKDREDEVVFQTLIFLEVFQIFLDQISLKTFLEGLVDLGEKDEEDLLTIEELT